MITLLGLNKILAIYVGPSGYLVLGQLNSLMQVVGTFASGGVNSGLVKYTAEFHSDEEEQKKIWSTSASIAFFCSVATAVIVVVLHKNLAVWVLDDLAFSVLFIVYGISIPFIAFNSIFLSILNGKKDIRRYVMASIVGNIVVFAVTSFLAINFSLFGAMIALVLQQSLAFFVTWRFINKAPWFSLQSLISEASNEVVIKLLKYSAVVFTIAICTPVAHIFIRSYIGDSLGINYGGYWEGMFRLSSAYLMFFTTTLSFYFLPKFSELKSRTSIRKELATGYKLILPVVSILGFCFYLFRDFLIVLLFDESFLPMASIFGWQMVGDTIKIAGWILAYIATAKAFTSLLVFSEIIINFILAFLMVVLLENFGLRGAGMAHAATYTIYFLVMFFSLKHKEYI
jgi:PST family polysaccharide transporter